MSFLFLLFGLLLSLWVSNATITWPLRICLICLIVFALIISFRRRHGFAFLVGFAVGLVPCLINFSGNTGVLSCNGFVVKVNENYFIFQSGLSRYYVYEKGCLREVGDFISINGYASPLSITSYESRFDFKSYLLNLGVSNQLKIYDSSSLFQMPLRFREYEKNFLSHFDSDVASFLDYLLFARKGENEVISSATGLSLLQLISFAGIGYSLFLRAIKKVTSIAFKEKTSDAITLILASLFLPLSFRKIGILRVFLKYFLAFLFKKKDYPDKHYFLFGLDALLIIALDYHFAFQSGFLLGFGLSFFMMMTSVARSRFKGFKSKLFSLLLTMLFLLPASISFSNGNFHLLSSFVSFLLMPLTTLVSLLGYISFVSFPFKTIFYWIYQGYLFLFKGLSVIDLKVALPNDGPVSFFLFYLALLAVTLFIEIKAMKMAKIVSSICVLSFAVSLLPFNYLYANEVIFLNVGQGDCAIIKVKDKVVMIDTGGNTGFDIAEEVLLPYLRKKRIYHIDYLIATHGDEDHIGGKDSLMSSFVVKNYIDDCGAFPLKVGDIELKNLNDYGLEGENESSLVLYGEFFNAKWLFMGDAPSEVENLIIKDNPSLDCDIIKIGHHGSSTSSSQTFIKTVSPKEAIISVGERNSYGHPSSDVISILKYYDVKIRRTDLEGTIVYRF